MDGRVETVFLAGLGGFGSRLLSLVVFKHRGFVPQGHLSTFDDVLIVSLGDILLASGGQRLGGLLIPTSCGPK